MAKRAKKVVSPKVVVEQPEVTEGGASASLDLPKVPKGFVRHSVDPMRFIRVGRGR